MDLSSKNLAASHDLEVSHSPAPIHIHLPSSESAETAKKIEAAKSTADILSTPTSSSKNLERTRITVSEQTVEQRVFDIVTRYCPELLVKNENQEGVSNQYSNLPLIHAVHKGDKDFVKSLILAGADLNAWDVDGYTALMYAAREGNKEIVDVLLSAQANLNVKNDTDTGLTALMYAIDNGHQDIVEAFITEQADLSIQDQQGYTALIHAINSNHSMISLLAKDRASLELKNYSGNTPLMFAVKEMDLEAVEDLLRAQANPNTYDREDTTPLIWALEHDQEKIALSLIQAQAVINMRHKNGCTPLMIAAQRGNLTISQELIRFGASLNAQNPTGSTALMLAALKGHENVVQALLTEHADVDMRHQDGSTPLMCAILSEHKAVACMLIEAGSQIEAYSEDGYSPLSLAILTNQLDLAHLLIQRSADLTRGMEVISRILLAHIWGLQGISKIETENPSESIHLNLEGMPLLKFSMKMLSEFWQKFFRSLELEDTQLYTLIPKKTPEKILECLHDSYPLYPYTASQILEKVKAENPSPFVILGGSEHHAISMVIYNDQLVICNRGEGRGQQVDTTTYYSLPRSLIDETLIEKLTTIQPTTAAFIEEIKNLRMQVLPGGFSQKNQEVGNCTWASSKAALRVICQFYTDPYIGKKLYKAFTAFTRETAFQDYRDHSTQPDRTLLQQMEEKLPKKRQQWRDATTGIDKKK